MAEEEQRKKEGTEESEEKDKEKLPPDDEKLVAKQKRGSVKSRKSEDIQRRKSSKEEGTAGENVEEKTQDKALVKEKNPEDAIIEEIALERRSKEEKALGKEPEEEKALRRGSEEEKALKRGSEEEKALRRGSEEEKALRRGSEEEKALRRGSEEEKALRRGSEEEKALRRGSEERKALERKSEDETALRRGVEEEQVLEEVTDKDKASKEESDEQILRVDNADAEEVEELHKEVEQPERPESSRTSSVKVPSTAPHEPSNETPTPVKTSKIDTLKNEMMYYISSLRITIPTMTRERDKLRLQRWVRFIADAKNVPDKEVRNKYLLFITISAINDECIGFLKRNPVGMLPTIMPDMPLPKAQWESDNYWDEMVKGFPCELGLICPVHKEKCRPNEDAQGNLQPVAGHLMDQEFKYFLFLASPYAALLPRPEDRRHIALWLQVLASIKPCSCAYMKGNRNDYTQALLGYLHDLRVPGPFRKIPPMGEVLEPLSEVAAASANRPGVTDPSGDDAQEFLLEQPTPESGALCYIALSGEPGSSLNDFNNFSH